MPNLGKQAEWALSLLVSLTCVLMLYQKLCVGGGSKVHSKQITRCPGTKRLPQMNNQDKYAVSVVRVPGLIQVKTVLKGLW